MKCLRRIAVVATIALALAAAWLGVCQSWRVVVASADGGWGVWVGPPDQPRFIVFRDRGMKATWVGGFTGPPTVNGCDWALAAYDDGGVTAQAAGEVFHLVP
jgi:hypothetical protein